MASTKYFIVSIAIVTDQGVSEPPSLDIRPFLAYTYLKMKRSLPLLFSFIIFAAQLVFAAPVSAVESTPLGIHILNISELNDAKALISHQSQPDSWQYVTIPFTLGDVEKRAEWQQFFDDARAQKVIPLVRLATKVDGDKWLRPNRKEVVSQLEMLSALEWPTEERHIIIFNEVNHAKEWGGTIDPAEYARTLRFAADWAHTEQKNFVVLGAAMDLAAPNGHATKEAFDYLDQMLAEDPEIFTVIDAWNSHSYPNPGFAAAPTRTGKNSLRGFTYELAYAKEKTGKEFDVYITETGWEDTPATRRLLAGYYQYALKNIWSDERIKAVTPFVLRGAPGPFAGFSFVQADGKPSNQYLAMKTALEKSTQ